MDWKKKKKEVSLPKRVILVIFQLVCAAVVGVSGIGLIYCLENEVFKKNVSADVYLDTEDCLEKSYNQFYNALYSQQYEEQFMADGELNLNQTVDITKLDQGISCKEKDPSTTYTLKQLSHIYDSAELSTWLCELEENSVSTLYEMEYEDEAAYTDETSLDGEMWTADAMLEKRKAFQEMLEGMEQPELLKKTYSDEFIYMYYHADEMEIELPESGERLADYALKNPDEISLMELYTQLRDAELAVGEFRQEMSRGVIDDQHEYRNSMNTMYYVQDLENDRIYTNVDEWKELNYQSVVNSLTGEQKNAMYTYQWRDGGRTNALMGDSAFSRNLSKRLGRDGEYYTSDTENVLVLLDTTLPYEDVIAQQSQVYMPMTKLAKLFPVLLVASVIGCILTTVLFCMWMGRRRYVQDETGAYIEVERPVQKVPIEVLIVIDIVLIIITCALVVACDVELVLGYMELVLTAGIWAVGLAVLVDVILFPLLAKGKTGSWKTNGLCVLLVRGIRNKVGKAYENRRITQKLTIVFLIIFVIELIILGVTAAAMAYGFGIFLMIILNIAIYVFLLRVMIARRRLIDGIDKIAGGNLDYQIDTTNMVSDDRHMAERMNNVREGMQNAIQEQMKSERLRTDLITNVSHDIKTPLTSIINYVDLLKREDVQDEKMSGYIDVLDRKSQRLKQLTEDLVEASKISSGNIKLEMERIDLKQLIKQISGEFEEKFEKRQLTSVLELPEVPMTILADGRRMCRVIENLYNNAAKYAMPGSRVYVVGAVQGDKVTFSMKNMSEYPLNISAEELMERFVRGDLSRTTEGSGLGLEIARNLTLMQKGTFDLYLDGDLFKVTIEFLML